jgi:hypothetical protein
LVISTVKESAMVGICWYRPGDYDRLTALFKAGEVLPDTYEEWLQDAPDAIVTLASQGYAAVKAYIDPVTFPEWCRTRRLEMDATARTRYGAEYARQQAKGRLAL